MSTFTRLRIAAIAAALVLALAACGGNQDEAASSPLAAQGRELANSAGCSACHGTDGRGGGVGPEWIGLAGSTVTLEDGSQVVADTDYVRRAIIDPSADVRAGYTIQMPDVNLDDDEVAALVAYIEEME